MRFFVFAIGCVCGILAAVSLSRGVLHRTAHAQAPVRTRVKVEPPAPRPKPEPRIVQARAEADPRAVDAPNGTNPTWQVRGQWQTSYQDAWQDALTRAQVELVEYLRTNGPPVEWTPTLNFIQERLVKDKREETKEDNGVKIHRITLDLELSSRARLEITQRDREFRAEQKQLALAKAREERDQRVLQRQVWAAKGLAALVVILGAVAGYVRLDEWSKGYYTSWLRLAALGFVGAAGVGLLLFS